jgi:uncharacterized cupin superfamily protein
MTPLHTRDEDESYRVLEGEVTFFVGDKQVTGHPGDVIEAPRGVARTLRTETSNARWLVMTNIKELERFADFGLAICRPLAEPENGWTTEEEPASLGAIAAVNGIELLGPPGALPAEIAATAVA